MKLTDDYYLKVLEVQKIYIEEKQKGRTNKTIYEENIRPLFYISMSTFYRYLSIPALKYLKRIGPKKNIHTTLYKKSRQY